MGVTSCTSVGASAIAAKQASITADKANHGKPKQDQVEREGRSSPAASQRLAEEPPVASANKHSWSGQLGDESNESATSSQNGSTRRRDQSRLRVVLPANQKSLVTPIIEPATPTQLLSSLVQFNSHFTGLPGCTPTSAEGLPDTGSLNSMNPFFWGVRTFGNGQPPSAGDLSLECATGLGAPAPSEQLKSEAERRQQTGANSAKSEGLQFILSPLSFLLSPDQESWRRFSSQAAAVAASASTNGNKPSGSSSQHQSPTSTADLPGPSSNPLTSVEATSLVGGPRETDKAVGVVVAQDLSSPQQQNHNQIMAHSHKDGRQQTANLNKISSQDALTSLAYHHSSQPTAQQHQLQPQLQQQHQNQLQLQQPQPLHQVVSTASQLQTDRLVTKVNFEPVAYQINGPDNQATNSQPLNGNQTQAHNLAQQSAPTSALANKQLNPNQNQMTSQSEPPPTAHLSPYAPPHPSAVLMHQHQQLVQHPTQPFHLLAPHQDTVEYQHQTMLSISSGEARLARQTVSTCPTSAGLGPSIRVQAPTTSGYPPASSSAAFALQYDTGQPIGIYDQQLRQLYLVQQQQHHHQQHQQQQHHQQFLYSAPQLADHHHHHHHHHQSTLMVGGHHHQLANPQRHHQNTVLQQHQSQLQQHQQLAHHHQSGYPQPMALAAGCQLQPNIMSSLIGANPGKAISRAPSPAQRTSQVEPPRPIRPSSPVSSGFASATQNNLTASVGSPAPQSLDPANLAGSGDELKLTNNGTSKGASVESASSDQNHNLKSPRERGLLLGSRDGCSNGNSNNNNDSNNNNNGDSSIRQISDNLANNHDAHNLAKAQQTDTNNTTKDLVTDCRLIEPIEGIKRPTSNTLSNGNDNIIDINDSNNNHSYYTTSTSNSLINSNSSSNHSNSSRLKLKDHPADSSNDGATEVIIKKKSKGGRKKKQITHEELIARKNRCKERNRVAAKRCRQKRKQFLDELHSRIDGLNDLNRRLQRENSNLRGEVELLKKHHKTCRLVVI